MLGVVSSDFHTPPTLRQRGSVGVAMHFTKSSAASIINCSGFASCIIDLAQQRNTPSID